MNILDLSTGSFITARTARDAVELMRRSALIREANSTTYMDAVAERVLAWCDRDVNTDTPEDFLQGLEAAGLITIYPEDLTSAC